jgi:ribosomal protein L35AE/L33A
MLPFIWDGDLVLVSPADGSEILVGDVICYRTPPGRLVLHRVIRRDGERLVVKGDALDFTELVPPGQVLGKVMAIERRGRLWRLARWQNRAFVLLSPVLPRLLPLAIRVRRIFRAALCG